MEKFLTPKKVREILKMPHTGTAQSDPGQNFRRVRQAQAFTV
jgi:hypothetical protein